MSSKTPAGDAGDADRQREPVDSIPSDCPHLHKLMVRSGGIFDRSVHWKRERVLWAAQLSCFARALDKLYATGEALARPRTTRLLSMAFETFVVLADPEWWQANPPGEVSEEQEERLREIREERKEALAERPEDGWAFLGDVIDGAFEVFVRAGYEEGLEHCVRLLDFILEPAAPENLAN